MIAIFNHVYHSNLLIEADKRTMELKVCEVTTCQRRKQLDIALRKRKYFTIKSKDKNAPVLTTNGDVTSITGEASYLEFLR